RDHVASGPASCHRNTGRGSSIIGGAGGIPGRSRRKRRAESAEPLERTAFIGRFRMTLSLEIRQLYSGYDGSHVLNGLDLSVSAGQIFAVLGRNGVGKTTMVNTVMGLVPASAGSVLINGADMVGMPTDAIARAGVGLVPQGRRVFAPLTVNENLMIAERHGQIGRATVCTPVTFRARMA